ncbi:hypothetical protein LP7551_01962 [Roseibium album]|nr:hypothetical protein LP7551_01962 [Roseibium album]
MQDVGHNSGRSFSNTVVALASDVQHATSPRVAAEFREIEGGNRPEVHSPSAYYRPKYRTILAKHQAVILHAKSTQMLRAHTPCLH